MLDSTSKSGQINQLQAVLDATSHRFRMGGAIYSPHTVPIDRLRGVILQRMTVSIFHNLDLMG